MNLVIRLEIYIFILLHEAMSRRESKREWKHLLDSRVLARQISIQNKMEKMKNPNSSTKEKTQEKSLRIQFFFGWVYLTFNGSEETNGKKTKNTSDGEKEWMALL